MGESMVMVIAVLLQNATEIANSAKHLVDNEGSNGFWHLNLGHLLTIGSLGIGLWRAHISNVRRYERLDSKVELMYDWFKDNVLRGPVITSSPRAKKPKSGGFSIGTAGAGSGDYTGIK